MCDKHAYVEEQASKAKDVIANIKYITLATVGAHDVIDHDTGADIPFPWISPLYTAFDAHYRFYWMSDTNSAHSKNIKKDPNIMGVLFDSTVGHGQGFGVYIKGTAIELDESMTDTIATGIELLRDRSQIERKIPVRQMLAPNPRRVYMLVPERVWVNVWIDGTDSKLDITEQILGVLSP